MVIAGIGTGGTITGIGQTLKPRKDDLKIVAVEPELSQVISGGTHSPHVIQGIGAGIIPDVLDISVIDEFVPVSNEEAIEMSRAAARLDGIPMGISSGAAVAAGVRLAKRPEMKDKMIVAIIPSFAERYLSTVLFENIWLLESAPRSARTIDAFLNPVQSPHGIKALAHGFVVDLSRNCAVPLTAYYTQKENDNGSETHSRI